MHVSSIWDHVRGRTEIHRPASSATETSSPATSSPSATSAASSTTIVGRIELSAHNYYISFYIWIFFINLKVNFLFFFLMRKLENR